MMPMPRDPAGVNERSKEYLPGFIGVDFVEFGERFMKARLEVRQHHLAPNGFLHAATVVALADTSAGIGCVLNLPDGATGFTTIELKSNFISTAREGVLSCEARLVHGGRTTQVWDAEVIHDDTGRTIALFRCTQMVLYPPSPR